MEKFEMYAQLYESHSRYNRACTQLSLLNDRLGELQRRYRKARETDHKTFRYNLRMKIMVIEGLITAYCNYACYKKNEVLDLRFKLYGENPDDGERLYRGFVDDPDGDDDEEDMDSQ